MFKKLFTTIIYDTNYSIFDVSYLKINRIAIFKNSTSSDDISRVSHAVEIG